MIIYMLLNTVTEKVYIGRTHGTLLNRITQHWERAIKEDGSTFLSEAIREWPEKEVWDFVVLQHCYDEKQLNDSEIAWIEICSARNAHVGYNMKKEAFKSDDLRNKNCFIEAGKKGAIKSKSLGFSKRKEEMTEEERERYREWGRKGARISKERALLRVLCPLEPFII